MKILLLTILITSSMVASEKGSSSPRTARDAAILIAVTRQRAKQVSQCIIL